MALSIVAVLTMGSRLLHIHLLDKGMKFDVS